MFVIGAEGLVMDQFAQVLLIQRDDSRTWALPGGGLEPNELPPDGMVREVFEETGYKVYPVRLVQLSYIRGRDLSLLIFMFRGMLRGGTATPSAESLQVGFVKTERLPRMVRSHRERLRAGETHAGGPPRLVEQEQHSWWVRALRRLIYTWKDVKLRLKRLPPYVPVGRWAVDSLVVIPDEQGRVLWVQGEGGWQLPGGTCDKNLTPWAAAAAHVQAQCGSPVTITDLATVAVMPDNRMTLCFVGEMKGVAAAGQWATLEEMETKGVAAPTRQYLQDALTERATTKFHAFTTKR